MHCSFLFTYCIIHLEVSLAIKLLFSLKHVLYYSLGNTILIVLYPYLLFALEPHLRSIHINYITHYTMTSQECERFKYTLYAKRQKVFNEARALPQVQFNDLRKLRSVLTIDCRLHLKDTFKFYIDKYENFLLAENLPRLFASLLLFCKDYASGVKISGRHKWDDKYFIDIVVGKLNKIWKNIPRYKEASNTNNTHSPLAKDTK